MIFGETYYNEPIIMNDKKDFTLFIMFISNILRIVNTPIVYTIGFIKRFIRD